MCPPVTLINIKRKHTIITRKVDVVECNAYKSLTVSLTFVAFIFVTVYSCNSLYL